MVAAAVAAVPLLDLGDARTALQADPVWSEARGSGRVYTTSVPAELRPWMGSDLKARRLWPAGYLNLVDGLALARTLVERGFSLSDLSLFEASNVVGGLCLSKTVDGFTYDTTGGHILFSKDAAVMQWMKDCAGGDEAFVVRSRSGVGDYMPVRFTSVYPDVNQTADAIVGLLFDRLREKYSGEPRQVWLKLQLTVGDSSRGGA